MKARDSWTPAQIEELERLYALTGAQYLSHGGIASAMNKHFPEVRLTANSIVSKVHREGLNVKYPRGRTTAHHIGNHSKGRKIGPTGFAAKKIVNTVASPSITPAPPKIKPHTVDPSKHCTIDEAMDAGTCLWPVNETQVCGCARDKSGSLARPSSYCVTHRNVGRAVPRKNPESDVYVSTRQKMSAMRYR